MEFDDLKQRLLEFPVRQFGQGASPEEIENAQQQLSVRFPDDYVAFLREFGWGGVEEIEIYGLGADVPPHLDLVRITRSEREQMEPRLPFHLLPIHEDGSGSHYCLDVKRLRDGKCPVVFWDHEAGRRQQPEEVAVDFTTWLFEMIEDL